MDEKKESYVGLLKTILKELVSNPDGVKVEKTTDDLGVLLNVKVNDDDNGLIIGRQGQTIQAIRTIVSAVGKKCRARVNIKIDAPPVGEVAIGQEKKPVSAIDDLDI